MNTIVNFFRNIQSVLRKTLIWTAAASLFVFIGFKMQPKLPPPQPAPEPIVIQWEVDPKFGDKTTKLPNGLTLAVYKDEENKKEGWAWSVSGVVPSESEAFEKVFKMGGVKK